MGWLGAERLGAIVVRSYFSRVILLTVFVGCAVGQQMKMDYLGELGHLAVGQRVGPATGVEEGVVRMEGPGWRWKLGVTGGMGWTELFAADFDRDGRRDFLVAEAPVVLMGHCGPEVSVTVLVFDAAGRPVPWRFSTYLPRGPGFTNSSFPYLPVWVTDRGGFEATDCEGKRTVVPWPVGGPVKMDGRIDELTLQGRDEGIVIGGVRQAGWPTGVIREGRDLRELDSADGWAGVMDAFRNGWAVKRMGEWLWVDTTGGGERADVRVSFVVDERARRAVGGGDTVLFGNWTYKKRGSGWVRFRGGTEEELLADGVTVRTAHTAMQHTVTGETRYARPPGAGRLMGVADFGDVAVTQWGDRFFALHSQRGELLGARVELGVGGVLVGAEDGGLVFWNSRELVTVKGRLVWRR